MDNETSIQELKERVRDFCEKRDWDQFHNAKELAIGIITEASELLEHFRFKSEQQIAMMFNDQKKKQDISEEIADVFIMLLRLVQRYDIDLSEEFTKKIRKNDQRYPIKKSRGSNKKYTEL